MANGNQTPGEGTRGRAVLAIGVTAVSIGGVIALAITVITTNADHAAAAQTVFTTVLPLMASWVGTVLAYYFSKENFEAATRSVTELAKQVTPQEKLKAIPVKDKMIAKDQMHFEKVTAGMPASQIKLIDLLERLIKAKKGWRIPVLDDNDCPKYVIHRSTIDRFIADKAISVPPSDPKALTLQDLLDDAELRKRLETSFAVVRQDASLSDAKDAMDQTPYCQDVFVTKGGTRYEAVAGWVTNVIIAENAKV